MTARATARAHSPETLAAAWLSRYTRAARPLPLRLLGWVPAIVPVGALAGQPYFTAAVIAAVIWFPVFVILSGLHDWPYRTMLAPLVELAQFPEPASERHVRVVAHVLRAAQPELTARPRPTAEQVGVLLRDAALTLFVRAEAEGCGAGHSDVCSHRRDTDAWLRWIAPEEFTADTTPEDHQ